MKNCRDSLPEAWGPWERQHAAPALQYPVSKIWIAGYWFWSRLSYIASASNQRRVVQIQLLASVGWKWGCQPFSWRCLQNVTHCRKETCSTCLFKECILAYSRQIPAILSSKDVHEEIRESVRVNYWVGSHDPARTSTGLMLELWITDGFEWFFGVNFLCPNLLSSLDPSNSYSCLSQWSFDQTFLVCGLQSHLLWHLAKVAHISM